MKLKASDLPDDAKRELLRQVRHQVGSTNYNQLVDRFGEDGLLDHALEKAGELAEGHVPRKKESLWEKYGWILWLVLLGLSFASQGWGWFLFFILFFIVFPLVLPRVRDWRDRNFRIFR